MILHIRKEICDFFNSIPINTDTEIGGLLFGYFKENECYVDDFIQLDVIANEYSVNMKYKNSKKNYYEKLKYCKNPNIIGIWHTHIGECDYLSKIDLKNFKHLNKKFNCPLVSVLILINSNISVFKELILEGEKYPFDEIRVI